MYLQIACLISSNSKYELRNGWCGAGVFDARATGAERLRENLSVRLRREFGLALPDDDDSRHAALASAAPSAPSAPATLAPLTPGN